MKLEFYAIGDALSSGQTEVATRLLLDYFKLSQPDTLPIHLALPVKDIPRILACAGDYFYEWTPVSGFDWGCHNYPLDPEAKPKEIDRVILRFLG